MKTTKMNKTLGQLSRVTNYMETFGCEYLLIDSKLVAHYGQNGLVIYDAKDTRKVARRYQTLLFWDNYKNDKVSITENVMNIQS